MNKMFWIDLEMTGLDYDTCVIIEAAVVITDLDLNVLEQYQAVVHRPAQLLAKMDPWCVETHGKSGLTAAVAGGRPLEEVEQKLLDLGRRHFGDEKIVLCGNCVQTDKRFIEKEMPAFARLLHYRVVDVSSWKEVLSSKYGINFEKKDLHRAKDDILESVAELGHYLKLIHLPGR